MPKGTQMEDTISWLRRLNDGETSQASLLQQYIELLFNVLRSLEPLTCLILELVGPWMTGSSASPVACRECIKCDILGSQKQVALMPRPIAHRYIPEYGSATLPTSDFQHSNAGDKETKK